MKLCEYSKKVENQYSIIPIPVVEQFSSGNAYRPYQLCKSLSAISWWYKIHGGFECQNKRVILPLDKLYEMVTNRSETEQAKFEYYDFMCVLTMLAKGRFGGSYGDEYLGMYLMDDSDRSGKNCMIRLHPQMYQDMEDGNLHYIISNTVRMLQGYTADFLSVPLQFYAEQKWINGKHYPTSVDIDYDNTLEMRVTKVGTFTTTKVA